LLGIANRAAISWVQFAAADARPIDEAARTRHVDAAVSDFDTPVYSASTVIALEVVFWIDRAEL